MCKSTDMHMAINTYRQLGMAHRMVHHVVQSFHMEATFVAAATTYCLLASAWGIRPAGQEDSTHFTLNGFAQAASLAVIALAIGCLWPASQITACPGAIAMPKSVLEALVALQSLTGATTILSTLLKLNSRKKSTAARVCALAKFQEVVKWTSHHSPVYVYATLPA